MIRVKIVAPFKLSQADSSGEVELPDRTTVGRLVRLLHAPLYAHILPVIVNGSQAGRRKILKNGDLVVFLVPISGGSAPKDG